MTGVAVSNRRTGNTNRGGRRGGLDMAGLLFEKLTVIRRATDEEVRALKWSNFTSARWLCRLQPAQPQHQVMWRGRLQNRAETV
jgi:hypothetical protein